MKWRDGSRYVKPKVRWNIPRKRAEGERFLRMAGAADVAEARALWKDPTTGVHRRCLAARANGLLGKHGPNWMAEGVEDDDSPLGRARRHGTRDADRRREAEKQAGAAAEALEQMRQNGIHSATEALRVIQDRSARAECRVVCADALGKLRKRDCVPALIDALGEGDLKLSYACMSALLNIRSRRGARRLIEIAGGRYPLAARQEAIYALWQLDELRAEPLFLRICAAVDSEEEYTRDMATEALGNTALRPRSQRALAARLFDPSPSIRYAALCACSRMNRNYGPCEFPGFVRRALEAKLNDPDRVDENRVIAELASELVALRRRSA
jgi:hypothetical protein